MPEHLLSDLHRALRSLLAQPLFFLTGVLTLALGICALAAIFTVYDAVLLGPLPYAKAERIVDVSRVQPPIESGPVSRPVFQDWHERSTNVFEAFAGYVTSTMNLTGAGDAERLTATAVTPDFWNVFANPVAAGRAWNVDEERRDERVVVLSDSLWRDRFAAQTDIIGHDILLNGTGYRVVGVTTPGFAYPTDTQIWLPTFLASSTSDRGSNFLSLIALLRDGSGIAAATQALDAASAWEAQNFPDNEGGLRARVQSLRDSLAGRFHQPLSMLLIASLLVLLIACANLANLMLARGQAREREFALRRALGADSGSLVRTVLTEAFVIAAASSLLGLIAAQPAVHALMAFAPRLLPSSAVPAVDPRVAAVVVIAALAALFIAGLAPAWRATPADPADTLRGGGRDAGATRTHGRLMEALRNE